VPKVSELGKDIVILTLILIAAVGRRSVVFRRNSVTTISQELSH
jgi:hypothetical protein